MGDTMERDDRILAYLQGLMDAEARKAFEAEMDAQPSLRAEVGVLRAAAQDLGARPVPEGVREAGWDRLSASIEAERMPGPANSNRVPQLLKVAAIVIASIGLWQVAVVPQLPGTGGGFVPASETAQGPVLRVAFAETAQMDEITALLQQIGAEIGDGPGAIGLYTLRFADDAARDAAEAALGARPDLVLMVSRP